MDKKVRFGLFEFDRQARELRLSGQRIPLQIQPLRVLEVLIERAGEVVTRSDLRAAVWPPTVLLDYDHGIDNAMTRLRQALGDSADIPEYIETLPRVGYRFIHVLEPCVDARRAAFAGRSRLRPTVWTIATVAAACAIVTTAVIFSARSGNEAIPASTIAGRLTANADAHDTYLRGMKFFEQRSKESVRHSIAHLQRATELDPEFAAAHAALAMAYTVAGGYSLLQFLPADEVLAPALSAAKRALKLNPNLASAHVALAGVLNQLEPWSAANDVAIEQSFRHALQLDMENADTVLFYGNFLSTRNRSDEAITYYRLATTLDPLSPSIRSRLGMELLAIGMTAEGLQYLRESVELDPFQFNARIRLGWAFVTVGDLAAAEQAFQTAEQISPESVRSLAGLAYIAARNGDAVRARDLLQAVQTVAEAIDDPFEVAIIYVGLEDRENSIRWLARTAQQGRTFRPNLPWGLQSPIYDWLRDDEQFLQIEQAVASSARVSPVDN